VTVAELIEKLYDTREQCLAALRRMHDEATIRNI